MGDDGDTVPGPRMTERECVQCRGVAHDTGVTIKAEGVRLFKCGRGHVTKIDVASGLPTNDPRPDPVREFKQKAIDDFMKKRHRPGARG